MQGLVMEMHECISISIFQEKGKISAKCIRKIKVKGNFIENNYVHC